MERRAAEPILPPMLFRNRVFVVTSAVAMVVGFALFGALTYLPLFQQVVRGLSPTASGLQLLPVMGGLLISSIVSGQIITRTGRYKAWPIAGTAIATLGMWLLSSLDETTSTGVAAFHMLVLGLGLGMVMQVLVLAVQNAVPYDMLGVATSGSTLFRSIGGSLGTAVLGAIFSGRLAAELAGGGGAANVGGLDPSAIRRLPKPVHDAYISAFTDALQVVFLVATVVVAVAFVLSWFIEERPLRKTVETNVGESLGAPVDTDSMSQLTRALSRHVGRERTLAFMAETVARAGVDLSPSASWALLRLGAPDPLTVAEAAALPHVDAGAAGGGRRRAVRRRAARRRAADRGGSRDARAPGRRPHRRAADPGRRLGARREPRARPAAAAAGRRARRARLGPPETPWRGCGPGIRPVVLRPPPDEAARCRSRSAHPHHASQREGNVKQRTIKKLGTVFGALLISGALAGTAAAVLTADSGGAMLKVDKRTNNVPSTTSATNWVNLPGATVGVFVPANQSRLFDVPFFAESQCTGPNAGNCTVRIVAISAAGTVELNPQAGADYAFDSDMPGALTDLAEGHGMERSKRLPGGENGTNYTIQVQFAVVNPQSVFTLDDWHLAVHTNA